jgi:hypothetical protein
MILSLLNVIIKSIYILFLNFRVDYVDSLGRTRRCMKKDLPKFMEMDRELGNEPGHCSSGTMTGKFNAKELPDLLSSDLYRQMLREKWEKEEKEAMDKPTGPVHYENIRFDGKSYQQLSAVTTIEMAALKI